MERRSVYVLSSSAFQFTPAARCIREAKDISGSVFSLSCYQWLGEGCKISQQVRLNIYDLKMMIFTPVLPTCLICFEIHVMACLCQSDSSR